MMRETISLRIFLMLSSINVDWSILDFFFAVFDVAIASYNLRKWLEAFSLGEISFWSIVNSKKTCHYLKDTLKVCEK